MVAGSQQQLHQQPPSSSSLPSAEEEAIKRNTDCVYFLASPLTCKKGSECEYRHSEYARVNPRDCWYWLNGSCLNPKCSFRHPPLDGLLGTQVAASTGSSLPSPQTAVTLATHTHNSSKQAVPCIFFQKGLCLKGDRCAFLHGPNPAINKAPPVLAAAPSTEPPSLKKAYGGFEKCKEQKIQQPSVSKSVEMPPVAKSASKVDTAPRNGVGNERNIPPPTSMDDELPRYRAENVPPMTNGNSISRSIRLHQTHVSEDQSVQNGRDADEFLRESSPGFDVLVDDELGDDDYYQSEDQYGRTTEHEGGNLNSLREYDIGHSADYSSMADVDQEMFHDSRGYDSYDRGQGQYNWEPHRASSERMSAGPVHVERRGYLKAEGPDRFEEPDLRHRLLKQRRVNGLRSVISHDYIPDKHVEGLNYRASRRDSRHLPPHERDSRHLTPPKRDSRHLPPHESSLSSRLKGRIKLSGRSSPVDGIDLHPERDMDRGRKWGRLSPGRSQNSLHQGRLHDRIKGRVQEDYNNGERNFRGPRIRREVMDDRETNFAGPKRLAELKVGKNAENEEQQSLGRQRNPMTEDHQQSEGDLSFEGPKPLSVILKRKRGAGAEASRSGILSSVNREEDNQREIKESLISCSKTTTLTEMHNGLPSASEEGNSNKEKSNFSMAKTVETKGKTEASHGQSSHVRNSSELETEDGMIGDEALEDAEVEDIDKKEGDYDYEQVDEGDYNFDEGENADPEEEYLEDEDGDDDFAKKIGVMFA